MSQYSPTIGLEIHAELKTRTKMFCASKNDPDEERPNVNICPICLAHPGTLPVINQEAIMHVLRVGTALHGRLADYTEFDRKNYFYPDLPKGYQISQYEFPLVSGGVLADVDITRVHLEEDTARSLHDSESGATVIDYNRAGVPLMELVTEPVITSASQAGSFARELQLLLRYLGASEANMEKGEMRVEANVSVGIDGKLGTKVEIKNLNSFRTMERAVDYEVKRQTKLVESGKMVIQETRGWDEDKQATFSQRLKEGSADYRYFPDPDLPSLKLSELEQFDAGAIERNIPELPGDRRARYRAFGVMPEDADLYTRNPKLGSFFEEVIQAYTDNTKRVSLASNYIANDLVKIMREIHTHDEDAHMIPISEKHFNVIMEYIFEKKISSRGAKDLLELAAKQGEDPAVAASERGLLQDADEGRVEDVVSHVLSENPKAIEDFRSGKPAALEFLVGKAMSAMRGAANPSDLRQLIQKRLGA